MEPEGAKAPRNATLTVRSAAHVLRLLAALLPEPCVRAARPEGARDAAGS